MLEVELGFALPILFMFVHLKSTIIFLKFVS